VAVIKGAQHLIRHVDEIGVEVDLEGIVDLFGVGKVRQ
jgi:hypothetical protein